MAINESAIELPFSFDKYGNVSKTFNQEKIWADRVYSIIGTALGERVMRPELGTEIRSSLFNTQSAMQDIVEETVRDAFTNQLSLLSLGEVTFEYDEVTNVMEITITYALPNRQISTVGVPVTVGTISISGNNLPKEVI